MNLPMLLYTRISCTSLGMVVCAVVCVRVRARVHVMNVCACMALCACVRLCVKWMRVCAFALVCANARVRVRARARACVPL
jgi:hypothetical protein